VLTSPRNGASPKVNTRPRVVKTQYPAPDGVAARLVIRSPGASAAPRHRPPDGVAEGEDPSGVVDHPVAAARPGRLEVDGGGRPNRGVAEDPGVAEAVDNAVGAHHPVAGAGRAGRDLPHHDRPPDGDGPRSPIGTAMAPEAALSARTGSRMPAPNSSSRPGAPASEAVDVNQARTWAGEAPGRAARSRAAAADTNGAAIEVPDSQAYPEPPPQIWAAGGQGARIDVPGAERAT